MYICNIPSVSIILIKFKCVHWASAALLLVMWIKVYDSVRLQIYKLSLQIRNTITQIIFCVSCMYTILSVSLCFHMNFIYPFSTKYLVWFYQVFLSSTDLHFERYCLTKRVAIDIRLIVQLMFTSRRNKSVRDKIRNQYFILIYVTR